MESVPGLVSDFDFHPDEPHVRQFQIPPEGVLRLDDEVFVSEAESEGIVLRHYAFRDEWFKINVTIDRAGTVVEPSPAIVKSFAYNCDIATPMQLSSGAVYATDLFVDVLVRKDGSVTRSSTWTSSTRLWPTDLSRRPRRRRPGPGWIG
jgi:hypothetical protein